MEVFLTQNFFTNLSEILGLNPRSEIRDPEKLILDYGPGSWGQKSTGSRIRIRKYLKFPLPFDMNKRGIFFGGDFDIFADTDLVGLLVPKLFFVLRQCPNG